MRNLILFASFIVCTVGINVKINAQCSVTASPDVSICAGDSTQLDCTPSPAGDSFNYLWTPATGLNKTNIKNPKAAPSSTITYTIQITDLTNPCTFSAPVIVTVHSKPVPTLTGPSSSCVGATGVTYTTEGGMSNYVWAVSSGGNITLGGTTTSSSVTITWITAGSQSVTVNYTNSLGCSAVSSTSKAVTVSSLPVPTITGPATSCAGATGVTTSSTENEKENDEDNTEQLLDNLQAGVNKLG